MGVKLRYCELCGQKITPDDLRNPTAFACKDPQHAESCPIRQKIDQALAKRQEQAAQATAGPAPGRPEGGGARPAAKRPSAKRPAAKRPAAKRPALKRSAGSSEGGLSRKASAGRASAADAGSEGSGRPARPSVGGGAARARRAPARPPRTPRRGPRVPDTAEAAADGGDDAPVTFQVKRRSNALLYGVLTVVVVLGVGIVLVIMSQKTPVEPEPVARTQRKPPEDPRKAEAEKQLALAEDFFRQNPEAFAEAISNFSGIADFYRRYPAGESAGKRAQEVSDLQRAAALARWSSIKGEVKGHFSKREFDVAAKKLEELPPIFQGYYGEEFLREYRELRTLARDQLSAAEDFDELQLKAARYAKDSYTDIAIAIVEAFPEKYQEDAPDVWSLKEETVQSIRSEGFTALLAKEGEAARKRREAELARLEQEKRDRERAWQENKGKTPWVRHLGRHNLYNWVIDADRYRVEGRRFTLRRDGDIGVLVGKNESGTCFLGPFTDDWKDYVLEFELYVREGTFQISPRTRARVIRGPMSISDQSTLIDFGEDYHGKWVTVTMEVHSDTVTVSRSDGGATQTFRDGEEGTRLVDQGGFVFFLAENSSVEIKNVRTKLVFSLREGKF